MLLNTLGIILSAEGFNALPAANGFDAIRVTREGCPMAVLIDLDRNGRDAPALIRSLRRASETSSFRVIGLSVDPRDVDTSENGVDAVIAKPLDVDALVTTLVVQMEQAMSGTRIEHAHVTG